MSTGGFSTLVGCDNIDSGDWVIRAAWAGFAGKVLVLVGHDGKELGRLNRG